MTTKHMDWDTPADVEKLRQLLPASAQHIKGTSVEHDRARRASLAALAAIYDREVMPGSGDPDAEEMREFKRAMRWLVLGAVFIIAACATGVGAIIAAFIVSFKLL